MPQGGLIPTPVSRNRQAFQFFVSANTQLLSINIATVMRFALNGVLHSPFRAHGAHQFQAAPREPVRLVAAVPAHIGVIIVQVPVPRDC